MFNRILEWSVSAIVVGIAVMLVIRTMWLMDRGFDFTDESFYIMWAQQPSSFDISYGLFGYGLHPLFNLVGGSVSGLRRVGAILIATAGIFVSAIVIGNTNIERRGSIALQVLSTSAVLPFTYYIFWLLTPSYNWFALIGGLLLFAAIIDLCDIGHSVRSSSIAAAAIALMMFARPQNALAYVFIYLLAVVIFVPFFSKKLKQVALTGLLAAVILGAIVLFSPITRIVDQIQSYLAIFGAHHPLESSLWERMFEFLSGPGFLFACSAMLFLMSIFTQQRSNFSHPSVKVLLIVAALILSVEVVRYFRSAEFIYRAGTTMGSIAYILLALACMRKGSSPRFVGLLGVGALLPLAATFGSADRIFLQLNFFCGIWGVIALFVVAGGTGKPRLGVPIAAAVCLSFVYAAIQVGSADPYRLAAPVEMQTKLTTLGWGSQVKLDEKTSKFIEDLQQRAKEEGFCTGDSAIDLGGARPGIVFAIGGRAPIFPWIVQGYQFSERLAREILMRVDERLLARTWLITGANSFSTNQLRSFGIDFAKYRLVVELHDPLDNGPVRLFAPRSIVGSCS